MASFAVAAADSGGRKRNTALRFATPAHLNQHRGRLRLSNVDDFFSDVNYRRQPNAFTNRCISACSSSDPVNNSTAAAQRTSYITVDEATHSRSVKKNLFRFSTTAASYDLPVLLSNDISFIDNKIRFIDDNDDNDVHDSLPRCVNDKKQKWLQNSNDDESAMTSPRNEKPKRQNFSLSAFITKKKRRRRRSRTFLLPHFNNNDSKTPRAAKQTRNLSTKTIPLDCGRHNTSTTTTTQKTTASNNMLLIYCSSLVHFINMRPCEACIVGASVLFTMLFVPTLVIGLLSFVNSPSSVTSVAVPPPPVAASFSKINAAPLGTPVVEDYVDDEIFDVFFDDDYGPPLRGAARTNASAHIPFLWLNDFNSSSKNVSLLSGRRSSRDLLRGFYDSPRHHSRRFQTFSDPREQTKNTELFDRFGFYGPNDETEAVFGRASQLINSLGGGGGGGARVPEGGDTDWPTVDLFRPPLMTNPWLQNNPFFNQQQQIRNDMNEKQQDLYSTPFYLENGDGYTTLYRRRLRQRQQEQQRNVRNKNKRPTSYFSVPSRETNSIGLHVQNKPTKHALKTNLRHQVPLKTTTKSTQHVSTTSALKIRKHLVHRRLRRPETTTVNNKNEAITTIQQRQQHLSNNKPKNHRAFMRIQTRASTFERQLCAPKLSEVDGNALNRPPSTIDLHKPLGFCASAKDIDELCVTKQLAIQRTDENLDVDQCGGQWNRLRYCCFAASGYALFEAAATRYAKNTVVQNDDDDEQDFRFSSENDSERLAMREGSAFRVGSSSLHPPPDKKVTSKQRLRAKQFTSGSKTRQRNAHETGEDVAHTTSIEISPEDDAHDRHLSSTKVAGVTRPHEDARGKERTKWSGSATFIENQQHNDPYMRKRPQQTPRTEIHQSKAAPAKNVYSTYKTESPALNTNSFEDDIVMDHQYDGNKLRRIRKKKKPPPAAPVVVIKPRDEQKKTLPRQVSWPPSTHKKFSVKEHTYSDDNYKSPEKVATVSTNLHRQSIPAYGGEHERPVVSASAPSTLPSGDRVTSTNSGSPESSLGINMVNILGQAVEDDGQNTDFTNMYDADDVDNEEVWGEGSSHRSPTTYDSDNVLVVRAAAPTSYTTLNSNFDAGRMRTTSYARRFQPLLTTSTTPLPKSLMFAPVSYSESYSESPWRIVQMKPSAKTADTLKYEQYFTTTTSTSRPTKVFKPDTFFDSKNSNENHGAISGSSALAVQPTAPTTIFTLKPPRKDDQTSKRPKHYHFGHNRYRIRGDKDHSASNIRTSSPHQSPPNNRNENVNIHQHHQTQTPTQVKSTQEPNVIFLVNVKHLTNDTVAFNNATAKRYVTTKKRTEPANNGQTHKPVEFNTHSTNNLRDAVQQNTYGNSISSNDREAQHKLSVDNGFRSKQSEQSQVPPRNYKRPIVYHTFDFSQAQPFAASHNAQTNLQRPVVVLAENSSAAKNDQVRKHSSSEQSSTASSVQPKHTDTTIQQNFAQNRDSFQPKSFLFPHQHFSTDKFMKTIKSDVHRYLQKQLLKSQPIQVHKNNVVKQAAWPHQTQYNPHVIQKHKLASQEVFVRKNNVYDNQNRIVVLTRTPRPNAPHIVQQQFTPPEQISASATSSITTTASSQNPSTTTTKPITGNVYVNYGTTTTQTFFERPPSSQEETRKQTTPSTWLGGGTTLDNIDTRAVAVMEQSKDLPLDDTQVDKTSVVFNSGSGGAQWQQQLQNDRWTHWLAPEPPADLIDSLQQKQEQQNLLTQSLNSIAKKTVGPLPSSPTKQVHTYTWTWSSTPKPPVFHEYKQFPPQIQHQQNPPSHNNTIIQHLPPSSVMLNNHYVKPILPPIFFFGSKGLVVHKDNSTTVSANAPSPPHVSPANGLTSVTSILPARSSQSSIPAAAHYVDSLKYFPTMSFAQSHPQSYVPQRREQLLSRSTRPYTTTTTPAPARSAQTYVNSRFNHQRPGLMWNDNRFDSLLKDNFLPSLAVDVRAALKKLVIIDVDNKTRDFASLLQEDFAKNRIMSYLHTERLQDNSFRCIFQIPNSSQRYVLANSRCVEIVPH